MRVRGIAAIVAAVLIGATAWAGRAAAQAAGPKPRAPGAGQVYLLRGLMDVFSQGMDALTEKLRRRGVNASVHGYGVSDTLAEQAAARYRAGDRRPIIIVGHSLGADAAVAMAYRLNESRVPVALIVAFSPSGTLHVPANVQRVVNYYQAGGLWNSRVIPGPGFRGALVNINLDNAANVTHFNIEKVDRLHAEAIARILALVGGRRSPPASGTTAAKSGEHSAN